MQLKKLPLYLLLLSLLVVVAPVHAFAADPAVGNEVLDAANTTLTRTGAGTAASPFKLQLNLGNANTWTADQTFNAALNAASTLTVTGALTANGSLTANNTLTANGTLNANGILNLGDGGDAASLSGSTVIVTAGDNTGNAFLLQEGSNKYLQLKTTNAAENISFGNATTNPSYSFLGVGSANFNGSVNVSSSVNANSMAVTNAITANLLSITNGISGGTVTSTGTMSANGPFNANGKSTFTPSGTNGVTINTDSDSKLVVTGLATASGNALCLDGSNNMVLCSASGGTTLQNAYDAGSTVTTSNSRDLNFNLADTATDSNFVVTTANGATGFTSFVRANGASTSSPNQLVLLSNDDTDSDVPTALKVTSSTGGVSTALDASDPNIVTALNSGTNDLTGTNWSIAGSTGNVSTSGNVAVNGGSLTTTNTTGNLFNTSATTVNIAGSANTLTLGGTFGTTTLRSNTVNLPNATSFNANSATGSLDTVNVGGGYGSTGTTLSNSGNVSLNGSLTVDGTSSLTGNVTTAGDVGVNGGDVTTTASTANVFNTNATTLNVGGAANTVNVGASTGTTTVNNDLNVTNLLTANGGATVATGQSLTANGPTNFNPNSTNNVTVNTDSDSFLVLNGLTTVAADPLCIDSSNNVVKCSGTPSDRRLKKNITNLEDVLPSVLKLQGVRYDLKTQEDSAPGQGKNIGFIAQDLEKYFPEVVKTDDNGIKSVDYEKMTAVLVESTKEQQQEIDQLKAEVAQLKTLVKNQQ